MQKTVNDIRNIEPIAFVESDFNEKFGVPRQSGLAPSVRAKIVFTEKYRDVNALRGIDGFSHLWLIWGFSENDEKEFSPTVRPPRLGGNERVGVFATRSPFRPNSLGLSCVEFLGLEQTPSEGTAVLIGGCDLVNGTPVYDIKPYLPYVDSKPSAVGGFSDEHSSYRLKVDFPPEMRKRFSDDKAAALEEILSLDPRPSYQNDGDRIYGFAFGGREIGFRVRDGVISVVSVKEVNG